MTGMSSLIRLRCCASLTLILLLFWSRSSYAGESPPSTLQPDRLLEDPTRIHVDIDLPGGADAVSGWPVTFGVPFPPVECKSRANPPPCRSGRSQRLPASPCSRSQPLKSDYEQ